MKHGGAIDIKNCKRLWQSRLPGADSLRLASASCAHSVRLQAVMQIAPSRALAASRLIAQMEPTIIGNRVLGYCEFEESKKNHTIYNKA